MEKTWCSAHGIVWLDGATLHARFLLLTWHATAIEKVKFLTMYYWNRLNGIKSRHLLRRTPSISQSITFVGDPLKSGPTLVTQSDKSCTHKSSGTRVNYRVTIWCSSSTKTATARWGDEICCHLFFSEQSVHKMRWENWDWNTPLSGNSSPEELSSRFQLLVTSGVWFSFMINNRVSQCCSALCVTSCSKNVLTSAFLNGNIHFIRSSR